MNLFCRNGMPGQSVGAFDVAGNLRLLPKFDERDPDTFFSLFERVAQSRRWPDADKILMLQCVFIGKAQEAYSALSPADSIDYVKVKAAVLKAYELVPEAYRQRFRNWEKRGQTNSCRICPLHYSPFWTLVFCLSGVHL